MPCAFCAMCALRARSRGGFSPLYLSTTRTRKAQMPQMHGHALLVRLSAESRRNASATPGETGETRPRLGATGTGGGGSKRPGGALSDRSLPLVSQRPPSRTFFLEHECLPNLLLTA